MLKMFYAKKQFQSYRIIFKKPLFDMRMEKQT